VSARPPPPTARAARIEPVTSQVAEVAQVQQAAGLTGEHPHARDDAARVMVDLPQAGLRPARGLLDSLVAANDASLGVLADVVSPGVVAVHDRADLVS
jgi:hypothetical protein